MPALFVSRALDNSVVTDEAKHVNFLIVVQSGNGSAMYKLLVAESRKAAGILIYYEAVNGNSVVFVGAVLDGRERFRGVLRRVDGLGAAMGFRGLEDEREPTVGVIC
jgi:hypothetical protein